MKSIHLVSYPSVGDLTIGDEPVFDDGEYRVYYLISRYEDIRVKIGQLSAGPFKHVAVDASEIYIYDDKAQRIVGGSLGRYQAYEGVRVDGRLVLQPVVL